MTYFKLNSGKKELTSLFDVMDSVLGGKDMFELSRSYNSTAPAVNLKENNDAYELELVAPGISKKDIKVEVNKNMLIISYTEPKQKEETVTDKYLLKEFGHRSFKRSFTLPELANKEDINGSYENGVLSLQIAKKEIEAPKLIEIA